MKLTCFSPTLRRLTTQTSKYAATPGMCLLLLSTAAFGQEATPAVSCESLAKLALPDTTITMAQTVAARDPTNICLTTLAAEDEQLAEAAKTLFGPNGSRLFPQIDLKNIKRVYLYIVTLDSIGGTIGMSVRLAIEISKP
jgi:hypothetical protein